MLISSSSFAPQDTTPDWYCIKRWSWYEIWVQMYRSCGRGESSVPVVDLA